MCNDETMDAVRDLAGQLVRHADELRRKFNDIEEEFKEGNLDSAGLRDLSRAIHLVETDTAAFERILGG